jgi:NAD(P)-dependent dehydrogenase (short-subunit alcohol dehydrogenase family)
VASIRAAGGQAVANHDDVSTWKGSDNLVNGTVRDLGRVDILVNNAGIIRDKMSYNLDEHDWASVIDVDLDGHFGPSHFAAVHWRACAKAGTTTGGRIINTTSESGLLGMTGQANYAAAKGGIAALTLVMARELERYGVTVNAISPRARTRMTLGVSDQPIPATGFDARDPGNVSPVVVWLASDLAADVNGQIFVVGEGRVYALAPWRQVGGIEKDGRWSPEEIDARRAELFGSGAPTLGPFVKIGGEG